MHIVCLYGTPDGIQLYGLMDVFSIYHARDRDTVSIYIPETVYNT